MRQHIAVDLHTTSDLSYTDVGTVMFVSLRQIPHYDDIIQNYDRFFF